MQTMRQTLDEMRSQIAQWSHTQKHAINCLQSLLIAAEQLEMVTTAGRTGKHANTGQWGSLKDVEGLAEMIIASQLNEMDRLQRLLINDLFLFEQVANEMQRVRDEMYALHHQGSITLAHAVQGNAYSVPFAILSQWLDDIVAMYSAEYEAKRATRLGAEHTQAAVKEILEVWTGERHIDRTSVDQLLAEIKARTDQSL